jgi:glycosyltransferase involved in cell wall biosynthesis
MNLMIVITSLELGGAERLVFDQLRLGRRRWDARVICLDSLGPLAERLMTLGIPASLLHLSCRWDVRAVPRLRALFRRWRPDVVHLHIPRAGVLGRLASVGLSHKVIYTEHNVWECSPLPTRWLNALTYHLNDCVIAVSEAVADSVHSGPFQGGPKGLPVVVPNGVDVQALRDGALLRDEARQQLGLGAEEIVVGNVANLFLRKGQSYLLEAAHRLREMVPLVRFVLIGSGDQEESLRGQAEKLGVADLVRFVGRLPDAYRMLPAFDIFCLPSIYEGMPVALLEAMALSLPVVATNVGGVPEIVREGMTGLLVPPANSTALADALLQLLEDENRRQVMGEAAFRTVLEKYSIDKVVDAYDHLYRQMS